MKVYINMCVLRALYGVQVDTKDVVIPDNVCQMMEQALQSLNITPIPQVPSPVY